VVTAASGILPCQRTGRSGPVFHADYTAVTTEARGEGREHLLLCDREGQTNPVGTDGYFVVDWRVAKPVLAVEVTVGGEKARCSMPDLLRTSFRADAGKHTSSLTAPSGSQNVILKIGPRRVRQRYYGGSLAVPEFGRTGVSLVPFSPRRVAQSRALSGITPLLYPYPPKRWTYTMILVQPTSFAVSRLYSYTCTAAIGYSLSDHERR